MPHLCHAWPLPHHAWGTSLAPAGPPATPTPAYPFLFCYVIQAGLPSVCAMTDICHSGAIPFNSTNDPYILHLCVLVYYHGHSLPPSGGLHATCLPCHFYLASTYLPFYLLPSSLLLPHKWVAFLGLVLGAVRWVPAMPPPTCSPRRHPRSVVRCPAGPHAYTTFTVPRSYRD